PRWPGYHQGTPGWEPLEIPSAQLHVVNTLAQDPGTSRPPVSQLPWPPTSRPPHPQSTKPPQLLAQLAALEHPEGTTPKSQSTRGLLTGTHTRPKPVLDPGPKCSYTSQE
ncbi:hypothetical protein GOODEAATRI_016130, partial [Goodea atripinnis]